MKYADYLKLEKKPENHVIGYFKTVDPQFKDYQIGTTIFVAIDEIGDNAGNITAYAPIGQHGALAIEYLESEYVIEISKEDYISSSKGIYTPQDYLENLIRMHRVEFEEMIITYNKNNSGSHSLKDMTSTVEAYQNEVENFYNVVVVLTNDDIDELNTLYFSKEK